MNKFIEFAETDILYLVSYYYGMSGNKRLYFAVWDFSQGSDADSRHDCRVT